MRKGDYPNAIIVLSNALKKDPDNLEIQKDLTFTYYLQRNYSASVESGRKLIARNDADEQCYQILGMALKAIDEKKEADKMYKQGIKKFPSSGELYNEYGEMLWVNQDAGSHSVLGEGHRSGSQLFFQLLQRQQILLFYL